MSKLFVRLIFALMVSTGSSAFLNSPATQAKSVPTGVSPKFAGQNQETDKLVWQSYCVNGQGNKRKVGEDILPTLTSGKEAFAQAKNNCQKGEVPVGVMGMLSLSTGKLNAIDFYFGSDLTDNEMSQIESYFKNK